VSCVGVAHDAPFQTANIPSTSSAQVLDKIEAGIVANINVYVIKTSKSIIRIN